AELPLSTYDAIARARQKNPELDAAFRRECAAKALNEDRNRVFDGSSAERAPSFSGTPMTDVHGDDPAADKLMDLWQAMKTFLPDLTLIDVENMIGWKRPDIMLAKRSTEHRAQAGLMERIHARAAAVQRQHPNMSVDECVKHVLRANKDLAAAYAAA